MGAIQKRIESFYTSSIQQYVQYVCFVQTYTGKRMHISVSVSNKMVNDLLRLNGHSQPFTKLLSLFMSAFYSAYKKIIFFASGRQKANLTKYENNHPQERKFSILVRSIRYANS